MKQWQKDFIELAMSITDEKDPDFRRALIEEGTEKEEYAKALTDFIKENNIDCRGCWEIHERYKLYEKLVYKMIEVDPGDPLDEE